MGAGSAGAVLPVRVELMCVGLPMQLGSCRCWWGNKASAHAVSVLLMVVGHFYRSCTAVAIAARVPVPMLGRDREF